MNINLLRREAAPGDIVLTGSNNILSKLIGYAQKVQTLDGKPSPWSHTFIYVSPWVVAESTIDFQPYQETGRRLDAGPQYNDITHHTGVPRALLLHFPFTDAQRDALLAQADEIIRRRRGLGYPIGGLLGSLLSYWVFKWKSNPLQTKRSLYCSAFVQEVYSILGIDFDIQKTARNTSPEKVSQYKYDGLVRVPV